MTTSELIESPGAEAGQVRPGGAEGHGEGVRRRGRLLRRALVAADAVGVTSAFALSEVLFPPSAQDRVQPAVEIGLFLLTLPLWVFLAKLYGLYDRDDERTDHSTADDFVSVFHLATVGTWLIYVFSRFTALAVPDLLRLFSIWAMTIAFVTLLRASARTFCRKSAAYRQNAIVIGTGEAARVVAEKFARHPEYGVSVVGFVSARADEPDREIAGLPVLGSPEQLGALIQAYAVDRVLIGGSDSHDAIDEILHDLKRLDVHVDMVPQPFERIGPSATVHSIEGLTLLALPRLRISRSSLIVKRTLDIIGSSIGLLLLLPVLAAVAVAVRLDSRGPVFYRHGRLGRGGRRFSVVKFRTMRLEFCRGHEYGGDTAEDAFASLLSDPDLGNEFAETQKLNNDPRVTRLGRTLREWSLDELPQLWNVLKGDMSLVGPRAITKAELIRYGEFAEDLLSVRPGLTGYWQINGRSRLTYDDRVRLDMAYLGGWSLKLDLAIVARTFRALLPSRGAI